MYNKLILVVVFFLIEITKQYPQDLPRCKAGDTECLVKVIQQTIQLFKNGRSDLNIPSLDPLHIGAFDIERGGQARRGAFKILMNFEDVDAFGISSATVTKVIGFTENPETSKYEMYATMPRISLIGNYKMNGNILVLPIQGSGKSNFTLDNIKVAMKFKPKVIIKNGTKYLQTDRFKLNIRTSRLRMKFENLFNGDNTLGQTVNNFLNENWEGVLEEFKPVFIESLSKVFVNLLDSFFNHVPYADSFLPPQ